jgi:hypothetical protein
VVPNGQQGDVFVDNKLRWLPLISARTVSQVLAIITPFPCDLERKKERKKEIITQFLWYEAMAGLSGDLCVCARVCLR